MQNGYGILILETGLNPHPGNAVTWAIFGWKAKKSASAKPLKETLGFG